MSCGAELAMLPIDGRQSIAFFARRSRPSSPLPPVALLSNMARCDRVTARHLRHRIGPSMECDSRADMDAFIIRIPWPRYMMEDANERAATVLRRLLSGDSKSQPRTFDDCILVRRPTWRDVGTRRKCQLQNTLVHEAFRLKTPGALGKLDGDTALVRDREQSARLDTRQYR